MEAARGVERKMMEKTTQRTLRRPLTAWELPALLVPGYRHRRRCEREPRERAHFVPILGFVYRNRFATASQIQRRFRDVLPSARTARRHLAEMEALGWLDVVPARGTSPLWPKIFVVVPRGARRLRAALAAKGKSGKVVETDRARSEGYSSEFVVHELQITEFLLAIRQTIQEQADLDLLRTERRSLVRQPALRIGLGGRAGRLIPDAMFVHREQGRGSMISFVELDNGSMSLRQIETKFRRYEAWSSSSTGQQFLMDQYKRCGAEKPRPVFRILMVVSDVEMPKAMNRMADLMATATACPVVSRCAWFTTTGELHEYQCEPTGMMTPLWRKIGDRRKLLEGMTRQEIRRAIADLPLKSLLVSNKKPAV